MEEFSIWCKLIAGWFLIPLVCTMGVIQGLFYLNKLLTPPPISSEEEENSNDLKD